MFTLHVVPFVCSTVNILLTDMVILKKDTIYMFYAGLVYMFANFCGTVYNGHCIYPIIDWANIPLTIFLFVLMAITQTILYYYQAVLVEKYHAWIQS